MKILILKPSSLGDVIQALPVLRLLKLHFPKSEIYWWLDSRLAPLLQSDPDLAGIIPFDRRRWGWPWQWHKVWQSLRTIRQHTFDWVIDLQCLMRSGLVAWFANGSLTIGLDDSREGARAFYDLIVPRPSYHTHAVDWYLEVLRPLNVPVHDKFVWLPEYPKAAATVRQLWNTDGKRWLVLQPGARWPNKRWPVEHFAELVRLLSAQKPELHYAILGSAAEAELGKIIADVSPERCLDLTGQTTLLEMIEWIRLSQLMVTNDTGPMHVAAALGKPVIAIFGPTDPRRTGPYHQLHNVVQLRGDSLSSSGGEGRGEEALPSNTLPCIPCMKDYCTYEKPLECLRAITPAQVCRRVLEMMKDEH